MTKKKTVLLVDDHPLFREGLKTIIAGNPGFKIVGEAGRGEEALKMAKGLAPDLVILDISLPDKNGIEVARELRDLFPDILIIILSMHSKIDYITECFKAGAMGYIVKDSAAEKLLQGLETVSRGDYFLDTALSRKVVEKILAPSSKETLSREESYRRLTSREEQILRLLAGGHSSKAIADKLFISPKTVENHRTNILEKLDLHSTMDLVRYAVRVGLIDPDLWKD